MLSTCFQESTDLQESPEERINKKNLDLIPLTVASVRDQRKKEKKSNVFLASSFRCLLAGEDGPVFVLHVINTELTEFDKN